LIGGVSGGKVVSGEHGDGLLALVHSGYGGKGDLFTGSG
jgi:hypothetical protein